jgi:hypothetical protein
VLHPRRILGFLVGVLALAASARSADDPVTRERQVRAAFIYNFAQFVEWPADAFPADDSPIIIGLIGDAPLNGVVEQTVHGKAVGKRPFAVRRFAGPGNVTPDVHLLVVPADVPDNVLQKLPPAGKPVLTVGESDGFCRAGGVIRLFTQANKVRFEIAPKAAERARLKVGAKLMKLAQVYEE